MIVTIGKASDMVVFVPESLNFSLGEIRAHEIDLRIRIPWVLRHDYYPLSVTMSKTDNVVTPVPMLFYLDFGYLLNKSGQVSMCGSPFTAVTRGINPLWLPC